MASDPLDSQHSLWYSKLCIWGRTTHPGTHPKKHNANNSVTSFQNKSTEIYSLASPNLPVSTHLLPNDSKQMLKEDQNFRARSEP